jgi:hypothetical protein
MKIKENKAQSITITRSVTALLLSGLLITSDLKSCSVKIDVEQITSKKFPKEQP